MCFSFFLGGATVLLVLLAAGYFGARQAGVGRQELGRALHTVAQWLMRRETPPAASLQPTTPDHALDRGGVSPRPNLLEPGAGNHSGGEGLPPRGPKRHRP